MTWRKPLVLAAALGLSIAAAHAQTASLDVPVQAGADGPELDACPRLAAVTGLDPKGDDFLSVRSGPGGRPYREVDRIHTGQRLSVCETRGPWLGVVYAAPEGQGSPASRRPGHAGPPTRDRAGPAGSTGATSPTWPAEQFAGGRRGRRRSRADPARAFAYPPFASRKNAVPMARRLRETQPQVVAPTPSSSVRRWATCANIAAQ